MLYEMVTGQLPFNDENIAAMLLAHFAEPPPPPCEVADWVHPTFENIILRCLEKKKEDRYQSMEELAEALRDFAGISDGPLNRVLGSGESCPSLPAVDDSPSLASLPPVTGMESTIPPPSTSGDCPAPSVWPEHVSGVRAAVDPIRSDTFGIGPREPSAAAASGTAAAWSRPEPMRPEPSPSPHPAGMLSARTPPPARAPSRVSKKTSRWYLAAVATLCFVGTVLAVVGLVIFLQRSAPLPVASPEPETIVVDVSGASPASADLEEPDLVRVQPVGRTLTIETDPVGAVVEVDGESVGVTPLSIARPAEGSTVVMRLTAPGYRPREVRLGHAAAPTVRLGLNRAVAPNLPPAARASVPESPPAHRANSLRSRSPNRARPTMDVLNPWGT